MTLASAEHASARHAARMNGCYTQGSGKAQNDAPWSLQSRKNALLNHELFLDQFMRGSLDLHLVQGIDLRMDNIEAFKTSTLVLNKDQTYHCFLIYHQISKASFWSFTAITRRSRRSHLVIESCMIVAQLSRSTGQNLPIWASCMTYETVATAGVKLSRDIRIVDTEFLLQHDGVYIFMDQSHLQGHDNSLRCCYD